MSNGAQNGNACTVDYNDQDCIYCGSTCSKITVVSEKCGDGIVQAIHDEKCDTKDDIKCKSDCSTCIEFYHSDDAGVCQANVCANAVFYAAQFSVV